MKIEDVPKSHNGKPLSAFTNGACVLLVSRDGPGESPPLGALYIVGLYNSATNLVTGAHRRTGSFVLVDAMVVVTP